MYHEQEMKKRPIEGGPKGMERQYEEARRWDEVVARVDEGCAKTRSGSCPTCPNSKKPNLPPCRASPNLR